MVGMALVSPMATSVTGRPSPVSSLPSSSSVIAHWLPASVPDISEANVTTVDVALAVRASKGTDTTGVPATALPAGSVRPAGRSVIVWGTPRPAGPASVNSSSCDSATYDGEPSTCAGSSGSKPSSSPSGVVSVIAASWPGVGADMASPNATTIVCGPAKCALAVGTVRSITALAPRVRPACVASASLRAGEASSADITNASWPSVSAASTTSECSHTSRPYSSGSPARICVAVPSSSEVTVIPGAPARASSKATLIVMRSPRLARCAPAPSLPVNVPPAPSATVTVSESSGGGVPSAAVTGNVVGATATPPSLRPVPA